MIEKINLRTFTLLANYVLVKADPAYDMVILNGPEGTKVELKIITFGQYEANHFSISGTVIKRPENFFYFNRYLDQYAGISQRHLASLMKASSAVDTDYDFQEGDKVYYNYNVQLSCEEENRLVETEEYGVCMLVPIDLMFGYERDGQVVPVNGYIFFDRDKDPSEYTTASGITVVQDVTGYEKHTATVISCSSPVRAYLDGGVITDDVYKPGDRIIVDRRFGYKMAYDLHAKELKNVEVILQKYVIAVLEAEPA